MGVAITLLLTDSDAPIPKSPQSRPAFSVVPEPQAGRLAARFRPRLLFDSRERWRPVSLTGLFDVGAADAERHRFCLRSPTVPPDCEPVTSVAAFEKLVAEHGTFGDQTYLDIPGGRLSEYRARDRAPQCAEQGLYDCGDDPDSAIYYRVTESNQRFYVDYWWFLRFNHFRGFSTTCRVPTDLCGDHEGDWEGVTLVTKPEDRRLLDYVVFAAHTGLFRYPADQLRSESGQRPSVFVAEGSHASYPTPCAQLCSQPIKLVGPVNLPETTTDGEAAWERNEETCEPNQPGSCLLAMPAPEVDPEAWTAWPGLWGETCGSRCGGRLLGSPQAPDSPGRQVRFQSPWCSTGPGEVPICDGATPGCRDWLGPVVAVLACDPRALGRGLTTSEELPVGELVVVVTSARPDVDRMISETTRGVVQALGRPLTRGDSVVISGTSEATEILLRVRHHARLLEARFKPGEEAVGGQVSIEVHANDGRPAVYGELEDGAKLNPLELLRTSLR